MRGWRHARRRVHRDDLDVGESEIKPKACGITGWGGHGSMIDSELVRRLVTAQFPQWSGLPIRPVDNGGWDNRTFHLGTGMAVRLPSAEAYAVQAAKEHLWLPRLAPALPFPIPSPLALGEPQFDFPWQWTIYPWLEGEVATPERVTDLEAFAADIVRFLSALQAADPANGPASGAHNFFRGGPLAVYDPEVRRALSQLDGQLDTGKAATLWKSALASSWRFPAVWVHGDVSPGNLLVREGRLAAVIDFGNLGVGDPACDLAIAWTFFSGKGRSTFFDRAGFDPGTWARARGWALWKALILAAGLAETNAAEWQHPRRVVEDLLQGDAK